MAVAATEEKKRSIMEKRIVEGGMDVDEEEQVEQEEAEEGLSTDTVEITDSE